jgi:putative GTP pyrophosphokinase
MASMTTHFQAPPEVSRRKVNKAGEALIKSNSDSQEYLRALEIANQWRLAHLYPINTFQSRLRGMVKRFPDSIVAQRLKRMPTIIDKLARHPGMQLSRMQDIGGVRAIVKDVSAVQDVVSQYETSKRFTHILKNKKDYIAQPKPDGYRGVHMVYQYNNTLARNEKAEIYQGLLLEVQIRTQEQHIWSTAVETMGTILKQPFKTRGGDSDWQEFFALMSSAIAVVEGTPVLDQHQSMRAYDIYKAVAEKAEKMHALELMTGYNFAAKVVLDTHQGFYNIIELDMSDRSVSITGYPKTRYKEASTDYAALELEVKDNPAKDVVLVSAGEIKTLRQAYPNYFLDINKFAKRLEAIIEIIAEVE